MIEKKKSVYQEDWERTVANKSKGDLQEIMRHQEGYESDFIDLVKEELLHRPDAPEENSGKQIVSEEYPKDGVIKKLYIGTFIPRNRIKNPWIALAVSVIMGIVIGLTLSVALAILDIFIDGVNIWIGIIVGVVIGIEMRFFSDRSKILGAFAFVISLFCSFVGDILTSSEIDLCRILVYLLAAVFAFTICVIKRNIQISTDKPAEYDMEPPKVLDIIKDLFENIELINRY